MAKKTVAPEATLTCKVEFDYIPNAGAHLLAVVPGTDCDWAIMEADCLDEGVRRPVFLAVQDGMSAPVAWLCEFAMGAARALRESAGVTS